MQCFCSDVMTVSCALVQLVVILAVSHIAIQCCTCSSLIEPYPANLAKRQRHVLHTKPTWIYSSPALPQPMMTNQVAIVSTTSSLISIALHFHPVIFFMCHTCSGHRGYMCLSPCSPYLLGQTLHTQAMRFVWTSLSQAMAILESIFFPDTPCTIPTHLALPRAGHKLTALREQSWEQTTLYTTLYTPHCALRTLHSHFTLYTIRFTLHTLHSTFHTLHSALFRIPRSTVHWYGNRGKMHKTVQKICFTKVFYVTAFGFVGCILFFIFVGKMK